MDLFVDELRQARQAADLTQAQLADKIGYSQSLVASVETGKRAPSKEFAIQCDLALGTGGLLARLLEHVLRQQTTPIWFQPWLDVERQATALRTYGPLLVPGLLQTEDYARALLRDETRVSTRMERQEILDALSDFIVVIDEYVLMRPIGSADVMSTQITRLLEDSRATVHVVPAATGFYSGLDGAFTVAVVDGTECAVVDNRLRGQVVELPEDLAVIRSAWEAVRSEALPRSQSAVLLKEACNRWNSSGASPLAPMGVGETALK
jgi:transcriptional regulator with XRE-family HTH domain